MVSKLRDRKNARLGIIILVLCSVIMSKDANHLPCRFPALDENQGGSPF